MAGQFMDASRMTGSIAKGTAGAMAVGAPIAFGGTMLASRIGVNVMVKMRLDPVMGYGMLSLLGLVMIWLNFPDSGYDLRRTSTFYPALFLVMLTGMWFQHALRCTDFSNWAKKTSRKEFFDDFSWGYAALVAAVLYGAIYAYGQPGGDAAAALPAMAAFLVISHLNFSVRMHEMLRREVARRCQVIYSQACDVANSQKVVNPDSREIVARTMAKYENAIYKEGAQHIGSVFGQAIWYAALVIGFCLVAMFL